MAAVAGVLVAGAAASGATFSGAGATDTEREPVRWSTSAQVDTQAREHGLSRTSRDAVRQQVSELRAPSETEPRGSRAGGVGEAAPLMPEDPREIALMLLPEYGWDESVFPCLDELWIGESNWEVYAENPTSGAYGIPQSLPPEKMATAGTDWRTNPVTQIRWGLGYIRESYGDPCAANEFKLANNWY